MKIAIERDDGTRSTFEGPSAGDEAIRALGGQPPIKWASTPWTWIPYIAPDSSNGIYTTNAVKS